MSQMQNITIQDIAAKANVSISTVSRVLNGTVRVAEAKKNAVMAAVDELEYQPNIFAQGLVHGHSMTIGVLTQNVSGPVYDAMLRGVLQGLQNSGYSPIFADGRWQVAQEQQAILLLMSRRIDGLIVLGGSSPESFLHQIHQEVPLIVVARHLSTLPEQCLKIDDFRGAYQATQYLLGMGHRSIAHITGIPSHEDAQARYQGYQQAHIDAGITPDPALVIEGTFQEQSGGTDIERNIRIGIQKIQNFQQQDGGFSYWPDGGNSDEWGTNYAGNFLLEASDRGYNVPTNILQQWGLNDEFHQ